MNEALLDSIGSEPRGGAPQDGPSTYWIDQARGDFLARIADQSDEPFAEGNVTYLSVRGGRVEARYAFGPGDDDACDSIAADDFFELLEAWRERVLMESPEAARRVPPEPPARPMPPR